MPGLPIPQANRSQPTRKVSTSTTLVAKFDTKLANSDLSNAMSSMSLAQTSALQDQKEREHLRSQFNAAKAASGEPMTAPMPTRANAPPLPATGNTMWSPEMGIKFASVPTQPPPVPASNSHKAAYPVPPKGGTWTPGAGVRFG